MFYNQIPTHLSLDKDAQDLRHAQPVGNIATLPVLDGLLINTFGSSFPVGSGRVGLSLCANCHRETVHRMTARMLTLEAGDRRHQRHRLRAFREALASSILGC